MTNLEAQMSTKFEVQMSIPFTGKRAQMSIFRLNVIFLKRLNKCVYCHEVETIKHLFFECTFNSQLLLLIKNGIFA